MGKKVLRVVGSMAGFVDGRTRGSGRWLRRAVLAMIIALSLSRVAGAVPELQLYIPEQYDSVYDPVTESWVTDEAHYFELWLLASTPNNPPNGPTIEDVRVSIAVPEEEFNTGARVLVGWAYPDGSEPAWYQARLSDPYYDAPLWDFVPNPYVLQDGATQTMPFVSTDVWTEATPDGHFYYGFPFLGDPALGQTLPGHGEFPTWFGEVMIGDAETKHPEWSALPENQVWDAQIHDPGQYTQEGLIYKLAVQVEGFSEVHFDAHDGHETPNKYKAVFSPFSHDALLTGGEPSGLGDRLWHDLNANGIQDGDEPGISGATVNLYDGTNTLIDTTVTNGGGSYFFTNLEPGDYSVEFIKPAGYNFSPQDQGANDVIDSDADTTTGKTIATNLITGEVDTTWDAGLFQYASISDFVWIDLDGDGIQDAGETGLDGVTVNLFDSDDILVATTASAADGLYIFENLLPGDYYLGFVVPDGYDFSPQDQGSDNAVDSDASPLTGKTALTTLTSGENDVTWDVGLTPEPPVIPEPSTGLLLTMGAVGLIRRRRRK
jgi:hypothetical protein